ncbi:MAG: hypothetical protein H6Q69_3098 [Firmicutes bacterium]|nr:hypothetical protein [Bacillota bacterium]
MLQKQRQPQRTDQEWLDLIQECRISGLSDKDWCEQHSIPTSTFYTKISRLRKKACNIPKTENHAIHESQQVIPLQIVEEASLTYSQVNTALSDHTPTVVMNVHGYSIEITNYAAKETIMNILFALQQLC